MGLRANPFVTLRPKGNGQRISLRAGDGVYQPETETLLVVIGQVGNDVLFKTANRTYVVNKIRLSNQFQRREMITLNDLGEDDRKNIQRMKERSLCLARSLPVGEIFIPKFDYTKGRKSPEPWNTIERTRPIEEQPFIFIRMEPHDSRPDNERYNQFVLWDSLKNEDHKTSVLAFYSQFQPA